MLLLSLGTAIFAVVLTVTYSILLKPLPYREQDQLIAIWRQDLSKGSRTRLSGSEFAFLQGSLHSAKKLAAVGDSLATVHASGGERQVTVGLTSADFFAFLGCEASAGRLNLAEEGEVLISETLWKKIFAGAASAVGSSLRLGNGLFQVAGIVPRDVRLPWGLEPEVWIRSTGLSHQSDLVVLGRLRDGTPLSLLQRELDALSDRLRAAPFGFGETEGLRAALLLEDLVGDHRRPILLLQGAAGLILLTALASLATLLATEISARRESCWIRLALGASHRRLFQQPVLEAALLGLICGAFGFLLARLGVSYLVAHGPPNLFQLRPVQASWEIGLVQLIGAVSMSIMSTVLPLRHLVRQASRFGSTGDAGFPATGHFAQRPGSVIASMLVFQVALSVVLAVAAALMWNSLWRIYSKPLGFDPHGLLYGYVALPYERYSNRTSRLAFFQDLFERLSAVQGVDGAATVQNLPLSEVVVIQGEATVRDTTVGRPLTLTVSMQPVSQEYQAVMGIPVVAGHWFDDHSRSSKVCVVNETLAKMVAENPQASLQQLLSFDGGFSWHTVVGVVADVRTTRISDGVAPELYIPDDQYVTGPGDALVVRIRGAPEQYRPLLQSILAEQDDRLQKAALFTFNDRLRRLLSQEWFLSALLSGAALGCLILATLGLQAMAWKTSALQTREIGIRRALGAGTPDLVFDVGARLGFLVLIGLAVGILAALLLSRTLSSYLFEIGHTDAPTYFAAALLLLLLFCLSMASPFWRAVNREPAQALRYE